jgi:hypothetical protein
MRAKLEVVILLAPWLCVAACADTGTTGSRGAGGPGAGVAGSAGTAPDTTSGPLAGANAASGGVAGAPSTPAPGTGAGGASGAAMPCESVGATRPCCDGGTQTCQGEEFPEWGACLDTGGAVLTCTTCLPELGNCDAGTPDAGTTCVPELGNCDGGVDAGPPPPTPCGPGMECKPGSVRYCDIAGSEWSKAICEASGVWGPCLPIEVPPEVIGHGDCSATDYSPEMCCPPLFWCCQDNPGGPFKDFGSGACAAVACP